MDFDQVTDINTLRHYLNEVRRDSSSAKVIVPCMAYLGWNDELMQQHIKSVQTFLNLHHYQGKKVRPSATPNPTQQKSPEVTNSRKGNEILNLRSKPQTQENPAPMDVDKEKEDDVNHDINKVPQPNTLQTSDNEEEEEEEEVQEERPRNKRGRESETPDDANLQTEEQALTALLHVLLS